MAPIETHERQSLIAPEAGAPPVPIAADPALPSATVEQNQSARGFERLHALVRKGYAAEIGTGTGTETVVLRHAGKAPDLVLHGDDRIVGLDGWRPLHKRDIDPPEIAAGRDADDVRFMKFLETVPKPSLRDRTRRWRHKYVYFPAILVVVWGLCLLFTMFLVNV